MLRDSQYGEYITESKISSGAFGVVYLGKNIKTHKKVAIKIKKKKSGENDKVAFMKKISGHFGFPKLYQHIVTNNEDIIIMELLGHNLEFLFKACHFKFSLKTVCMIAIQMISRVQLLHNLNIIHCDVKPENFIIGLSNDIKGSNDKNISKNYSDTLYLIDFGLSDQYMDKSMKFHRPWLKSHFVGTARYASLNAHNEIQLSRRDDMISLGYIFVYFMKGCLPWQSLNKDDMAKLKYEFSPSELCSGLPNEFESYLSNVLKLDYDEEPDYNFLKNLFYELMIKNNFVYDFSFDWKTKLNDLSNLNHISNVLKENKNKNMNRHHINVSYSYIKDIRKMLSKIVIPKIPTSILLEKQHEKYNKLHIPSRPLRERNYY